MTASLIVIFSYVGIGSVAALAAVAIVSKFFLPSLSVKEKHVVVVGGSSGIGLAISELVLKEGGIVSMFARNEKRLEDAKAQLTATIPESGTAIFIRSVDVADPTATKLAFEAAISKHGPVDILICSQGVSRPMRLEDLSEEYLHEVMNANYWGCINSIRAVLPSMKQTKDPKRIALISSQAGQVGLYGLSHYSATKFALNGLAQGLQQEFLPYNIKMSLVFPPDTDTPLLVEENKTKHPVTKILSESSGMLSAHAVAKSALSGIKNGLFSIPCNLEGFFLAMATAGMSPQPSLLFSLFEVAMAGILRIVAIVTVASWVSAIKKWHNENEKKEESSKEK